MIEIITCLLNSSWCFSDEKRQIHTWWAIEQYPFTWGHSKLEELIRMLNWILHQLLQFTFDALQTANITP